jgi:hypothetical protein
LFERASYSATTQSIIAPCGGHLGFIASRSSDPDRRWLDWRVADWVQAHAIPARLSLAQAMKEPHELPVVHET